jgi:hypothetical protein
MLREALMKFDIQVVDRYILAVYHSLGIVGWLAFLTKWEATL